MSDTETQKPMYARTIPQGSTITNIRRGQGARERFVYATLVGPDGELIISATLDYITAQIMQADITELTSNI